MWRLQQDERRAASDVPATAEHASNAAEDLPERDAARAAAAAASVRGDL
jgi:hypothetical protein